MELTIDDFKDLLLELWLARRDNARLHSLFTPPDEPAAPAEPDA